MSVCKVVQGHYNLLRLIITLALTSQIIAIARESESERERERHILAVLGSVLLSPGCDENKRGTFACIGLTKVRLQHMSDFSTLSVTVSTHPTDLHSFL